MTPADYGAGVLSISLSFNSYSSGKLAEIADRVVGEFRQEIRVPGFSDENNDVWEPATFVPQFHDFPSVSLPEKFAGDDDEFEFATVCREPYASIIPADEIFYDGEIRPTYPLFGAEIPGNHSNGGGKLTTPMTAVTSGRSSLRMLMSKDREVTSLPSSLAVELVGVSPETYCVWSAKDSEWSREAREKSKSSESSKRWRFMKEMLVLLNAINKKSNKNGEASEKKHGRKGSRVGDNAAAYGGELQEKLNQTEEHPKN